MKILYVDHQDSFAFNLVQELGVIVGTRPIVMQSTGPEAASGDRETTETVIDEAIRGAGLVVLGPGPGRPASVPDAGLSLRLLNAARGRVPVFGVCFGLQLIVHHFGGHVRAARRIVHGHSLPVRHGSESIFAGLTPATEMMRYHSLVADPVSLPAELTVTAWSGDDEIMALEHREEPIWAVQFHPESVGSTEGSRLLENLVRVAVEAGPMASTDQLAHEKNPQGAFGKSGDPSLCAARGEKESLDFERPPRASGRPTPSPWLGRRSRS